MTPKLRLHYAPDNASLCVRIALLAADLPFETQLVDRAHREQKSGAYLELNPNGLIPVLETPDGPIFETGAILMWVADHARRPLLSPRGTPAFAQEQVWMFWLANTLHANLRSYFYPDLFGNDADDIRAITIERLRAQLTVLEQSQNTPWLEADEVTALSAYLGPMLRWMALYGSRSEALALHQWPRLFAFAQRAETTAPVRAAALAEGLGETVFSAPQLPNPPEGSAL